MQDFLNKKVVLGVCGGIAAYKSAYLVRELQNLGAELIVVMTNSAKEFITPLTFQALTGNPVRDSLWDSEAERAMGHIELARWADYFVIAPATANCIAKFAQGIADDLLSTLYLVAETPVVICPAMNKSMWSHPATQQNCAILKQRGVRFVGPELGSQACGEFGYGRLALVNNIINSLRLCSLEKVLEGQELLITAGPTVEPIDPVRYLSNYSSGKMGYALASAAAIAGARVKLISGPCQLLPPPLVEVFKVKTAKEMHQKVMEEIKSHMIFVGCAAVADYTPRSVSLTKLKKDKFRALSLELEANPDILSEIGREKKAAFVVGFAAETENLLANSQKKLREKEADMIIANQVGEKQGFEEDCNAVTVLLKDQQLSLAKAPKQRLAGELIAMIAANFKMKQMN